MSIRKHIFDLYKINLFLHNKLLTLTGLSTIIIYLILNKC